ncbi:unnamed protein product [Didymodactylos carnosus]|uniref:TRPM-like domain-containing protein n=2 Tax=Didymodactylos carnosus TaxID=1234261 RepID=A0A814IXI1_9BILA|nr:unnamed protein product [Didymodactylos carnosus]CAF3802576.1 unnamed protein product [Didymodactylos carnosus]
MTNISSKYVRLAYTTPPAAIVALLVQAYRLPVPDFILSLNTSGIDADARSHAGSNVLVTTSAINSAAVALAGRALNTDDSSQATVPCLGFGSWTHTAANDQLRQELTSSNVTNNCIKTMSESLHQKTGELAETLGSIYDKLIAYQEYLNVKSDDLQWNEKVKQKRDDLQNEAERRLQKLTIIPREDTIDETNQNIEIYLKELVMREHLVTVYSSDRPDDSLEDAIYSAFLKKSKWKIMEHTDDYDLFHRSMAKALLWTIIWSDIDYARANILHDSVTADNPVFQTIRFLVKILMLRALPEALRRNNWRFVALLVENGASFDGLNNSDIKIIFESTKNVDALPLKKSFNDKIELSYEYHYYYLQGYFTDVEHSSAHEENMEKLFLWFIYMNYPNMAKYICFRCKNPTVACLLASKIYRRAAHLDTQRKEIFTHISKDFDRYAAGIIDECFRIDQDFATELLHSNAVAFYNCIAINIAREADCQAFLASETVQKDATKRCTPDDDKVMRPWTKFRYFYEAPVVRFYYHTAWDAFYIFVCFILIFLFAFSITAWSLLTATSQVTWAYTENGTLYNVTVSGDGGPLWSWELLRDVPNWGLWKIVGQIDEPYDNNTNLGQSCQMRHEKEIAEEYWKKILMTVDGKNMSPKPNQIDKDMQAVIQGVVKGPLEPLFDEQQGTSRRSSVLQTKEQDYQIPHNEQTAHRSLRTSSNDIP